jgi:5'-nucleotidase/UDP-sugar diphosphatase
MIILNENFMCSSLKLFFTQTSILICILISQSLSCAALDTFISSDNNSPPDIIKELVILHTNDLHSRLAGYAPESEYTPLTTNDDKTIGGFARIARIIKQEKDRIPESVLVLDAGDFLMGTLFHALEPSNGFQLRLMKEMGYDAVSIGNHEFDFGIRSTAEIIRSSVKNGQIPPILLANIQFNSESSEDDNFEALYDEGIIKPYQIIEKNGLRIGIFGILGYDATNVAPYITPAKIDDPIKTARKITNDLRNIEKADLIICLSHSGVTRNDNGVWEGEDVKLASKVNDIDIIISGHTHTYLPDPIFVGKTIIVQAGANGAYVGKMNLAIKNGRMEFQNYHLIPVNDSIQGDFKIHTAIESQKELIQKKILDGLGMKYDDPVVSSSFELICDESDKIEESNLGPLLADAIRYYINSANGKHTDIALIAAGVIRDQLVTGTATIADIFRISSMGKGYDNIPGYPLSMVYVTGNELKKIIEVLLFAYKSSLDNFCYYSGLRVHFNPSKGMLRKIISIEIEDNEGNYKQVDFSKDNTELYSIAANSYILEFVGLLKKKTFGIVKVYPKNKDGVIITDMHKAIIDMDPHNDGVQEGKEWIALYNFVRQFKDINHDGVPDIPDQYKNPSFRVIPVGKD